MKILVRYLLFTSLVFELLQYFVVKLEEIKLELLLIPNLEVLDSNHFDFDPLKPHPKHPRFLFLPNLKNLLLQKFQHPDFNFIITNLVMQAQLVDYKLHAHNLKELTHYTFYILEYRSD